MITAPIKNIITPIAKILSMINKIIYSKLSLNLAVVAPVIFVDVNSTGCAVITTGFVTITSSSDSVTVVEHLVFVKLNVLVSTSSSYSASTLIEYVPSAKSLGAAKAKFKVAL